MARKSFKIIVKLLPSWVYFKQEKIKDSNKNNITDYISAVIIKRNIFYITYLTTHSTHFIGYTDMAVRKNNLRLLCYINYEALLKQKIAQRAQRAHR